MSFSWKIRAATKRKCTNQFHWNEVIEGVNIVRNTSVCRYCCDFILSFFLSSSFYSASMSGLCVIAYMHGLISGAKRLCAVEWDSKTVRQFLDMRVDVRWGRSFIVLNRVRESFETPSKKKQTSIYSAKMQTDDNRQSIKNWNEVLERSCGSISEPVSPYSRRRHYHTDIKAVDPATIDEIHSLNCGSDVDDHNCLATDNEDHDQIVIVFESPEGSPYSRRHPAHDKYNRCVCWSSVYLMYDCRARTTVVCLVSILNALFTIDSLRSIEHASRSNYVHNDKIDNNNEQIDAIHRGSQSVFMFCFVLFWVACVCVIRVQRNNFRRRNPFINRITQTDMCHTSTSVCLFTNVEYNAKIMSVDNVD